MNDPKEHTFEVKFILFERKLKATVKAVDEIHAMDLVKEAIKIESISRIPDKDYKPNEAQNKLKDLLDQMGLNF